MNEDELAAISAMAEAATSGPWMLDPSRDEELEIAAVMGPVRIVGQLISQSYIADDINSQADAEFIAAARTAVPALVAALAEAHRDMEKLRAFVQGVADHGIHADTMPTLRIPSDPTDVVAWFYGYLDRADQDMRKSARAALAATGETE